MKTPYILSNLIADLDLTVLTDVYQDLPVSRGYCCDMLSWAMSRLDGETCWFTILNSINVIAVASLAGCPCVVLTENVSMDEVVLSKAKDENICICVSAESTFDAAARLADAFKKTC
jgi:hypothetical protein